ncbi:hypothetical protein O3P69_013223 [Scylla paramamosain]|uniref:Uncharacterized protein n=1 Tax=Scylla paramamosain TaxID=85552 RepID=A0AAW0TZ29_SCYPA
MLHVRTQNLLLGMMILLVVEIHSCEAHQTHTKRLLNASKIYRKYDIPVTHIQAIDACRIMRGRLALPENKEEDAQMRRIIGKGFSMDPKRIVSAYWLRADDKHREGNWTDSITALKKASLTTVVVRKTASL